MSPTIEDPNGGGPKLSRKITPNGTDVGLGRIEDVFDDDPTTDLMVRDNTATNGISTVLRGPANTPYAAKVRKGELNIATPFNGYGNGTLNDLNSYLSSNRLRWSLDPCEPGGTEHCNFNTPTVHVGGNVQPRTSVSALTISNNNIFDYLGQFE
jgi:hypothetical protein